MPLLLDGVVLARLANQAGRTAPADHARAVARPAGGEAVVEEFVGQRAVAFAATAAGLSTVRTKCSSDPPNAESALVNMNGSPELSAEMAPRY